MSCGPLIGLGLRLRNKIDGSPVSGPVQLTMYCLQCILLQHSCLGLLQNESGFLCHPSDGIPWCALSPSCRCVTLAWTHFKTS